MRCDHEKIKSNINSMILSASGWRKIFSYENGENKNEDSLSKKISLEDIYIVSSAAYIFGQYIFSKNCKENAVISVGLDSRPTGPAIGEAVVKTLLSMGIEVRYHFIIYFITCIFLLLARSSLAGRARCHQHRRICVGAGHRPPGRVGLSQRPQPVRQPVRPALWPRPTWPRDDRYGCARCRLKKDR